MRSVDFSDLGLTAGEWRNVPLVNARLSSIVTKSDLDIKNLFIVEHVSPDRIVLNCVSVKK